MTLLSKFVDIATGHTFGADSGIAGVQYRTVQHSLGTTPDVVQPIIVSVGVNTLPPGAVIGVGGNASISTVMLVASTLGNTQVNFSVLSQTFHSLIR